MKNNLFIKITRTIVWCGVVMLITYGISVRGTIDIQPDKIVLVSTHALILPAHEHGQGDSAGDRTHHQYLLSPVFQVPHDVWLSGISFDMVNAPDTVVHHMSLLNHSEPHQTCSDLPYSQRYIMAQDSMHFPRMNFPEGTGMFFKGGDYVQMAIMIHNPLPPIGPGDTYYNVYGKLTLSLRPAATTTLRNIMPSLLHIDDEPCVIRTMDQTDAYVFQVPPRTLGYEFSGGVSDIDPATFAFQKPSTITHIGAHLHGWQGGKRVYVEKNGKPFLTFDTATSTDDPYRYDTPYYPTELSMSAGDTLSIRAVYDNPSDTPTRGAMGDLQLYYYEHE